MTIRLKRILILSDAFVPPLQGMRVRHFAQYLQNNGYDCSLATEILESSSIDLPIDIRHYDFRYYRGDFTDNMRRLADKLFFRKERQFERFVEEHVDVSQFDLIIASAYLFPVSTAYRLARKHNIPLILDLRDIVEQWDAAHYLNTRHKGILTRKVAQWYLRLATIERNKALRYASAVTTVSQWHQQRLSTRNKNTHTIYNGFSDEYGSLQPVRSKTFNIIYTGKIYDFSLRNPQMLFAAVEQMLSQGADIKDLRILFFVEDHVRNHIERLAMQHQIPHLVQVCSFVKHTELLTVMQQSSICLILNNPSGDQTIHGIIPSKFYEALGARKPVLCVPADHDSLQQMVEKTGAGICADNIEQIQAFISEKYAEWKTNGFVEQRNHKMDVGYFSRLKQSAEFSYIVREVLNSQTHGSRK